MPFETIFITEGDAAEPAAEIQFDGQRLCLLRRHPENRADFVIEFISDRYAQPDDVKMSFSLASFNQEVGAASAELRRWLDDVARSSGRV